VTQELAGSVACPRCGSTMVTRHNRETGEAFLGCPRFPACRGTRQLGAAAATLHQKPTRYRLSAGGRPRTIPDVVELLVARRLGRNLGLFHGFLVQAITLLVILAAIWVFVASGLFLDLVNAFSRWYTDLVMSPLRPTPSP
jgi:hypothetical protein